MMLRFFASACLLAGLAGCTAPPPPVAAANPRPIGERGTILAMRPVPASDPLAVRTLLARLGGGFPAAGSVEFIVRREDGEVLAVVQPGQAALQPGQGVLILPGVQTQISPIPAVAVR